MLAAVVRTSISIVGPGPVITRVSGPTISLWSEIALLTSGAVMIVAAHIRMIALRRRTASSEQLDDYSGLADALLLVLMVALFLMLIMVAIHVT